MMPHPVMGREGPGADSPILANPVVRAVAVAGIAFTIALLAIRWHASVGPLTLLAGFTRIAPARAAEHPARAALLRVLRSKPGACAHELADKTGMSRSLVQHHLRVLEQADLVEFRRLGRLIRVFAIGQSTPEEKARALSDRGCGLDVLTTVQSRPGIAQRDIAAETGLAPSTVHWHVRRLEAAGVLRSARVGRWRQVWATERLPVARGIHEGEAMMKTKLRARDVEALENTSVAIALGVSPPGVRVDSLTLLDCTANNCCSGGCSNDCCNTLICTES